MQFDKFGFPRPNGATDFQDSAFLAGMMVAFDWPEFVPLSKYIVPGIPFKYVRHPTEDKGYDFSRDQYVGLSTGYAIGGDYALVDEECITGKDYLSPSINGHTLRCKGLQAKWYQDLNFWADLWFSAKVKPMEELNQLFCMMRIADKKFVRWYCMANPKWRQALRNYWYENEGKWRDEGAFCEHVILQIEKDIA